MPALMQRDATVANAREILQDRVLVFDNSNLIAPNSIVSTRLGEMLGPTTSALSITSNDDKAFTLFYVQQRASEQFPLPLEMLWPAQIRRICSASIPLRQPSEQANDADPDFWVRMPPRSERRVVMKARYEGRGKPRPFRDPFASE